MKNKTVPVLSALILTVCFSIACSLFTGPIDATPQPDPYYFEPVTELLIFEPDSLPAAQVGVPYEAKIQITQNVTPLNSVSISNGALPAGLELVQMDGEDAAMISGIPEGSGTYKFTVFAGCVGTMVSGQIGEKEYEIVVTDPAASTASGLPVSYDNITFEIPLELNASVSSSKTSDVEFPYINPSNGPMAEHTAFQFTNFPTAGTARLMVFKASEYAAYGQPLQEAVTALLSGADASQPLPDGLLQGEFSAQAQPINFKNGHGVRQLTQVLTNFAPITNEEVFYYYQGITTDGEYFVSAIFHVNATFLVSNGSPDAVTPADGVPFGNGTDLDFPAYLSAVTKKLNDAPADSYTPSLLILDRLIESIQIAIQ